MLRARVSPLVPLISLMTLICAGPACSGGDSTSTASSSSSSSGSTASAAAGDIPMLTITSPADGATVNLSVDGNHRDAELQFTVTGFRLFGCDAFDTDCGAVFARIDGDACNGSGAYNSTIDNAESRSLMLHFDSCDTAVGQHTIELFLKTVNGLAVRNASAGRVSQTITVTTATP